MRARVKRFGLVLSLINAGGWIVALGLLSLKHGHAPPPSAYAVVAAMIIAGPFVYIAIATTVRGFIWAWSGK